MRILGIDPGTRILGYGIVEERDGALRHLRHGTIRTTTTAPLAERLVQIRRGLVAVLDEDPPDAVAVEGIFHARNVQSAIKLAHARGVALALVAERGIALFEYAPMEVKRSVVGYGRAAKDQVGRMMRRLLALDSDPPPDAADALALAVCHLHTRRLSAMRSRRGGVRRR